MSRHGTSQANRWTPIDERAALVRFITDRVADRLVEAIEADEDDHQEGHPGAARPLAADPRRQQLLVGAWLSEEIATANQDRMHRGEPPLPELVDREIRARVVAELTGTGPLEPYMSDPVVEEIDVNSHESTWVTYADGRKIDVGRLWESSADLTAYQKRLARRMTGTGEGRLDTQSPMLTFQADDGSRVVMVLGGRGEHGISTHPRIAIRRFVLRHEGLDGLARRGLFPPDLVPKLRAMIRTGFTLLVSGPPGAGKTTLLTELLGEVSPRERIITVEKNLLELRL
ncbi:MAG: ATPase, T2SS/T4P/T4SS family, partial [Acidimicrobiia bacterium]